MKSPAPFAVIIPSKTSSNLIPCLAALYHCEPEARVIVVDDGLDVQGRDQAKLMGASVYKSDWPFIFAKNCNIGIRVAAEAWPDSQGFCLCNDDAELQSAGGFSLLAETCAAHPEIGVIGATTNVTGQPLQQRHRIGLRFVPHIAFVAVYIPKDTIEALAFAAKSFVDLPRELGWPPEDQKSAAYAASKLSPDGLLDERYCLDYGCDDADYCEQLTRIGLKVAVHDGCFVDHSRLRSTFRGDAHAAGSFKQNYKLLMNKWGTLESQRAK